MRKSAPMKPSAILARSGSESRALKKYRLAWLLSGAPDRAHYPERAVIRRGGGLVEGSEVAAPTGSG
jgi:hypothetical protein